jgi:hypothetical protein
MMKNSWQAEDDLHTLAEAKKIQADPKRMKACQMLAKEKMTQMANMPGMQKHTAGIAAKAGRDMAQMDGENKNK